MADKKPQGEYGSQREAGYADPGLQSDGRPRYPLKEKGQYSKDRIHAAATLRPAGDRREPGRRINVLRRFAGRGTEFALVVLDDNA
jgi:hypothetical protein